MTKSELVNGLREEYQQWLALLNQIGAAHMEQPGVAGEWSIKDIVAHITGWRRRTVARLQAAQRGEPEPTPYWPTHLKNDDEINAWMYETNRARTLRKVLDESERVFQQMLAAVQGLPDAVVMDPPRYLPWWEGATMSAPDFFAHFHQEHEADMRAWLARVEKK